jgi:predicted DNA-binding transcriptional regulator YafY
MGRLSHTETLAKLLVAFLEHSVWKQKDLERRCGVATRSIRTRILDLQAAGIPIEREEDPPHVYYSVPKGWFPGVGGLDAVDHVQVARLVARLPRSAAREQMLTRLVATAFGAPIHVNGATVDVSDEVLTLLEDGVRRRVPIRTAYYTASRGEHGLRTISAQRIVYGRFTRVVGYCHQSSCLKWFRGDRMTSPTVDAPATFLEVDPKTIEKFVAESLDGFSGPNAATTCTFLLREKESHWALRNWPPGSTLLVAAESDGPHVTIHTSALDVLARHLVSLGGIVREIQPLGLRSRVQALARESLQAANATLNVEPVGTIRSAK